MAVYGFLKVCDTSHDHQTESWFVFWSAESKVEQDGNVVEEKMVTIFATPC